MNKHFFRWGFLLLGISVCLALGVQKWERIPLLQIGNPANSTTNKIQEPTHRTLAGELIPAEVFQQARGRVYVFLATQCPISNGYLPELHRLQESFETLGIQFYGVISGTGITLDDARAHQREYQIQFPVLWDTDGEFQKWLRATHTPQAILIDNANRIRYSGRIDNAYADLGKKRFEPTQADLQNALNAMISGNEIAVTETTPIGCRIESLITDMLLSEQEQANAQTASTWTDDIAKIIYKRCANCHRPGEAAPFSLLTYDEVQAHARQIEHVVTRRLMPPWKAEPGFGEFHNEQRLTDHELHSLTTWLANDLPRGNANQEPLPPQFVDGWSLGQPDLILTMPEEFTVPADGADLYQHFVIPANLSENRLVSAMEFRPGNANVVHHAMVYLDTTGKGRELDAADPGPGYARLGTPGFITTGSLGGWGPGGSPRKLPDGLGRIIPKDSDIVLQIHYHPTGRDERDRSQIGLYFAPRTAQHPVGEIVVANVDLDIPAGATRHYHRATYTLPVRTLLFDVTPHMHVLGKEIKATAYLPNSAQQPLIWIKNWDFYWQDHYVFKHPIWLPAGTEIVLECWYDNSNENPLNPHSPPQRVTWGDNSDDEMGNCYFQVTTETETDYIALMQHAGSYFRELWERTQQKTVPRKIALPPLKNRD